MRFRVSLPSNRYTATVGLGPHVGSLLTVIDSASWVIVRRLVEPDTGWPGVAAPGGEVEGARWPPVEGGRTGIAGVVVRPSSVKFSVTVMITGTALPSSRVGVNSHWDTASSAA